MAVFFSPRRPPPVTPHRDAVLNRRAGEAPPPVPRQGVGGAARGVGAAFHFVRFVEHEPFPGHAVQERPAQVHLCGRSTRT